ncbi:MAG: hypothetical protein GC138_07010 [Gammaproteobacteria bacterium]|nr:hypothetical protein [Gammaproteobacteria bacterium]
MNLSTIVQCLGQRDLGIAFQTHALEMKRVYTYRAVTRPARARLLILVTPGDLSDNMPLDCLLEHTDIDLIFYYVTPGAGTPFSEPLPEHDAVIIGIVEADANRALLATLDQLLEDSAQPVINAPGKIAATERGVASALLQNAPGLLIPQTLRASREDLQSIASGGAALSELFEGCDFPVILRPVGSHGGHGLEKIDGPEAVAGYLGRVDGGVFFLSRFVDYSREDGLFRKIRVALIDGEPFACHMAVSTNWMIHYVNADMYTNADRRLEEAAFMADFDAFAERHRDALAAICERTELDYVCIDCAETLDGELLIFEIDHAMVVHAMDPEEMFPYKQVHMRKVRDAFRNAVFNRVEGEDVNVSVDLSATV